jgi:hypothetical protein
LAICELMAILWCRDISVMECKHAAFRRLLRLTAHTHTRDFESVSADALLLFQRVLESKYNIGGTATPEHTQPDGTTGTLGTQPIAQGVIESRKKKASSKLAKGGKAQRSFFSEELRDRDTSQVEKKSLFTTINQAYNQHKARNTPRYQRCVAAGEAAVAARGVGGYAFGPPAKKLRKVAAQQHVVELMGSQIVLAASTGMDATRPKLSDVLARVSPMHGASDLQIIGQLSPANREIVRQYKVKMATAATQEVNLALSKFAKDAVIPPLPFAVESTSQPVSQIGTTPKPGYPGVDVLWVPAPGSELMRYCLSGRTKWKTKGRSMADLQFRRFFAMAWKQRHRPHSLKDIPTIRNVAPDLHSKCWHAGFCICKLETEGISLSSFASGLQAMLAKHLVPGAVCRSIYNKAALVMSMKAPDTPMNWCHIAWGNLNTRHYTCLNLQTSVDPRRAVVAQAMSGVVPLQVQTPCEGEGLASQLPKGAFARLRLHQHCNMQVLPSEFPRGHDTYFHPW